MTIIKILKWIYMFITLFIGIIVLPRYVVYSLPLEFGLTIIVLFIGIFFPLSSYVIYRFQPLETREQDKQLELYGKNSFRALITLFMVILCLFLYSSTIDYIALNLQRRYIILILFLSLVLGLGTSISLEFIVKKLKKYISKKD